MDRRPSRLLLFLGFSLILGPFSGHPALALDSYTSTMVLSPAERSAQARGVAVSDANDVYVIGFIEANFDADEIWIAKYDSDLVLVSSATAKGSAGPMASQTGIGIDVDDAGNVYAVGYVENIGTGQDIWVAKYDADLVLQASVTINGAGSYSDRANGVIADDNGNVYVVGEIADGSQNFNIWIAKFDSSLSLVQSQTIDGAAGGSDGGHGIALCGGNVFATGVIYSASTDGDAYIGKFTTDLVSVDDVLINGSGSDYDIGHGIACDANGDLYVSGRKTETTGGSNLWVGKFDSSLNSLASQSVDGPGTSSDMGHGITIDKFNRVIVAGAVDGQSGDDVPEFYVAAFDSNLAPGPHVTTTAGGGRGHGVASDGDGNIYAAGHAPAPNAFPAIWITKHGGNSAGSLRVVANPASVLAGATTQVTVTVLDSSSNPVPDQSVHFSVTAGSGQLDISSGTTNGSGVVTAVLSTNGLLPSRDRIRITSGGLSADFVVHSAMQVSPTAGGTVTCGDDPDTKLTIPANAFRELVDILIKLTGDLSSDDQDKVNRANQKNRGRIVSAIVREFNALKQDGSNYGEFDGFVTVEIPYTDNDNDGTEDSTGIPVKDLKILRLDEISERWREVKDSGEQEVDEARKVIRTKLQHFSIYSIGGAAAAGLDDVVVYPNPINFASAVRNTLKFGNLSANSEITIYDVTGRLVRRLKPGTPENDGVSGLCEWQGKNESGEAVAAGLYYFFIKDDGGNARKGRFAVTK